MERGYRQTKRLTKGLSCLGTASDLAFHGIQTTHGVEPFKQFVPLVRTAQGRPAYPSVAGQSSRKRIL